MNPSEFFEQVQQAVPEIDLPELGNASVSFLESSKIVEQIDFDTTSNNSVTIDRSLYWKTKKQVKHKTKCLKQIIHSLTLSPLKNQPKMHNVQPTKCTKSLKVNGLYLGREFQ